MAAYLLAEVEVTDSEKYEEYRKQVPATIEQYGGRFLVRGGATETVEGDGDVGGQAPRVVVLEFPSMERLKEWYNSPEYSRIIGIRLANARSRVILAEGA